jgi:hypothetical protein
MTRKIRTLFYRILIIIAFTSSSISMMGGTNTGSNTAERIGKDTQAYAGEEFICGGPPDTCETRLLIPAYFFPQFTDSEMTTFVPDSDWDRAVVRGPGSSLPYAKVGIMIVNPDSGSGTAKSEAYAKAIDKARSMGIKILGYVPTSNGLRCFDCTTANRPSACAGEEGRQLPVCRLSGASMCVKKDIDNYYDWYNLDGIFLDEVQSKESIEDNCETTDINETCTGCAEAYYKPIVDYIHRKRPAILGCRGDVPPIVTLNPGTIPDVSYANILGRRPGDPSTLSVEEDIIILLENTYLGYVATLSTRSIVDRSPWTEAAHSRRVNFAHLVHTVDDRQSAEYIFSPKHKERYSRLLLAMCYAKSNAADYVYITDDLQERELDVPQRKLGSPRGGIFDIKCESIFFCRQTGLNPWNQLAGKGDVTYWEILLIMAAACNPCRINITNSSN